MSDTDEKPLDYDEVVDPIPVETEEDKAAYRGSLLELIPITLIVIAVLMRRYDISYHSQFFVIGGSLAALFYLFFSWYMFKIDRYNKAEVILSVLCGLVFPVGILGMVFQFENYSYASDIMTYAIYSGGVLFAVSLILFIIKIRDDRASVFYRNILARLLIFCALLIRLNWDLFM